MDPQSKSFTPYVQTETWRLQNDLARVQQVQSEHAERITRLERRQDDDARMKSVWGSHSPFPSVLSGTPQQAPRDRFRDFEDEANNLMSSLHLDAEEEPRRALGAASRANSVRFDETANQNHFSHSSRPSMDLMSRTSSGIGGLSMNERSSSHKSDGRASSAHSMRSAASGRASSLNLDTGYSVGDSSRSPLDTPALAPGLLLLGAVPAIIRCWMNTNFKHDALLYAAVCTGSYKSYLDVRLIQKLGFEEKIVATGDAPRSVELPVYFPEAVPHPASSRSSSPAPQLPTLTVNFQVIESSSPDPSNRPIQIFIGSDTLRAHSADILLSTNSMTLFDDERSKLSIPLVRPENEDSFKCLRVVSEAYSRVAEPPKVAVEGVAPYLNGMDRSSSGLSVSSAAASPPPPKYRPPGAYASESGSAEPSQLGTIGSENDPRPASRASGYSRPSLGVINTRSEAGGSTADSAMHSSSLRSGSSPGPATWSSWRRDSTPTSASSVAPTQSATLDWAAASRNRPEPTSQRKDTGMKILKPKSTSRTASTSNVTNTPTDSAKSSRFFDEGRRKSDAIKVPPPSDPAGKKENQTPTSAMAGSAPKPRNPIGGGSAFSWLTSGGGSK